MSPSSPLRMDAPLRLKGEVVRGFGRGSKDLGIPTANFPESTVEGIPEDLCAGVYFGWARLGGNDTVYPMVMSIGWNPFYHNTKKTAETHILHQFDEDFYGQELSVLCVGFIRAECDFESLQALIEAIENDISVARSALALPLFAADKMDDFLACQ